MRNRARIAGFAFLVVLGTACSSGGAGVPVADDEPIAAAEKPDPTCPLTGLDPTGVGLDRAAVAVKVENSPDARPQSGLESADVVFEEIVEGGITRFMAIYHCGSTEKAGPVRSARFDDPKIAAPFTDVLVYSGSNGIVDGELTKRGLLLLNETTAGVGLFRDPPGSYTTHNLFANVKAVRRIKSVKKQPAPKGNPFSFGELTGRAKKARSVAIKFNPTNVIEYRWENNAWTRYEAGAPFMTAAGGQIAVPNVLIQEVDVNNSTTIRDVAGNPSPDIDLSGKGRALLFRDGSVVKGTWEIAEDGGTPVFTNKAGEPMVFAPGPIWIELVPSSAGSVKGSVAFSKRLAPSA